MTFKADVHEPSIILQLLGQIEEFDGESNLNQEGWADYYYTGEECYCHESWEYNVERKTWTDLLGLESVEEQLQNQLTKHPSVHNRLIIEGVAEPAVKGIYIYDKMQGQNNYKARLLGERQQSYKQIVSWLHQIGKYWDVKFTNSMTATAITLVANYEADNQLEESHLTLKRTFKPYYYRTDPQEARIMGMAGSDVPIGPKTARALREHFGTAWRVAKASPEELMQVKGMGKKLAVDLLRGIGRGDI